jgi:hypothetical protein
MSYRGKNDTITTPEMDESYRRLATDFWCTDELEIDTGATVSPSQFGAWVQAWVWVDKDQTEVDSELPPAN